MENTQNTTGNPPDSIGIPANSMPGGVSDQISAKLQAKASPEEKGFSTPHLVDLHNMSKEEIQYFKRMLEVTPSAPDRKNKGIQVRLRKIDDKIVADFKNAYTALIEDPENNRKIERHLISIKFFGENEFHSILYSKFINAEQVFCDVLSVRTEVEELVEGEVVSMETGKLVDMVRKITHKWYKVKLPDGKEVEIEGRLANA